MVLSPIPDQFVQVLLSKQSNFFDFDIVLDAKRSAEVNPAPWVQFLRTVDKVHAKWIFIQPFLSFHLAGRPNPRVDDGVFPWIDAFLCRGSPAISGDTTNVYQLGFQDIGPTGYVHTLGPVLSPFGFDDDEATDLGVRLFAVLHHANTSRAGRGRCSCVLDVEHGEDLFYFSVGTAVSTDPTHSAGPEEPISVIHQLITCFT